MLKFADVRGAMHYSGKPPTQLRKHRKRQGLDEETSCRPSAPPPGQTGKSSRRPERWQQSSLTSRGCRHLAGGLPKFQCAGNRELFKCVVSGRSHEGSFQNPTVSISPAATRHTLSPPLPLPSSFSHLPTKLTLNGMCLRESTVQITPTSSILSTTCTMFGYSSLSSKRFEHL